MLDDLVREVDVLGVSPGGFLLGSRGLRLLSFVVSLNLHRRHLNESQRAMVANRLANLNEGRPKTSSIEPVSQPQAAEMLNVAVASVKRAKTVQEAGSPELITAVESGALAVSAAAVVVKEYADAPEILNEIIEKQEVAVEAKKIRERKAKAAIAACCSVNE